MNSTTSYWSISLVSSNLLAFFGLQNNLLYKILHTITFVAMALQQMQTSTALAERGLEFNTFNTSYLTLDSSISSSQSHSYLPSSSPLIRIGTIQAKTEKASLTSTPFSISGFNNNKTSVIMGVTNSISALKTTNVLRQILKNKNTIRSDNRDISLKSNKHQVTTTVGKLQANFSTYKPTYNISISNETAFKYTKRSKKNIKVTNVAFKNSSSLNKTEQQYKYQDFPLNLTLLKNHRKNADAAIRENIDADKRGASHGYVNLKLHSLSTVMPPLSSSALSPSETEKSRIYRNKYNHEHHLGPFFEEQLNATTSIDKSKTTSHLYTETVLNCRVGMLKDKTVMWVRRTSEKVSLLTVGNVTYSSDPRIRIKFQYPNNWRLLINPTQHDDAGIYMCQVSTHPPRVFATNLTVLEPPLRLIDDQDRDIGDRYYKTGSTIDLYCQVSRSFLHKEKHNILESLNVSSTDNSNKDKSLQAMESRKNYLGIGIGNNLSPEFNNNTYNRNNVNVYNNTQYTSNVSKTNAVSSGFVGFKNNVLQQVNEYNTFADVPASDLELSFSNLVVWSKDYETLPSTVFKRLSLNDKWFASRITITDAKLTDSGNYTCSVGRMYTAIVQVQVLTGEMPAAVQHNSAAALVWLNESVKELVILYGIYSAALFMFSFEISSCGTYANILGENLIENIYI